MHKQSQRLSINNTMYIKLFVVVLITALLALTPTLAFAQGVSPADVICYAVSDGHDAGGIDDVSKDTLLALTPENNNDTSNVIAGVKFAGTNSEVKDIEAIAFSPDGQTLYGANGDQLGTLNLTSAEFTPLASKFGGGFDDVDGLGFDPTTGILYGIHRNESEGVPDVLFQINHETGAHIAGAFNGAASVTIPTIGQIDDVDDIALHPQTGVLYAVMNDQNKSTPGVLAIINKSTGAIEESSTLHPTAGGNLPDVEGLTFSNDPNNEVLYGSTGQYLEQKNLLWQIPLNTISDGQAVASRIGPFDGPIFDIEALACRAPRIGDLVWDDLNFNGVQDAGEPGIAGVNVVLLNSCADTTPIQATTTDANGVYGFSILPGSYVVKFSSPSPAADWVFTGDNRGDDITVNSTADGATGCTPVIELTATDLQLEWDAGFCRPPALSIDISADSTQAQPGNPLAHTVTYNNDGSGDAQSATVTLVVPEYTTFSISGSSAGWSCADGSPAGTSCTNSVGNIIANTSGGLTFVVNVDTREQLPEDTTGLSVALAGSVVDGRSEQCSAGGESVSNIATPLAPTALVVGNEPSMMGQLFFPRIGQ